MYRITRLFAALLLLLAAVITASPTAGASPAAQSGNTVVVEAADGNVFRPTTITINVGDTVTWRNTDDVPHTSTQDDGVWDSGTLNPGEEFSFTFEEAGTYSYFCEFHPGMVGTVVVEEAQDEEPTPTATPEPTEDTDTGGTDQGDQQRGDDQQGGDTQQGETPHDMPETGAGRMAGGGFPIGNAAAAASLLLAGGYALIRRR